jgi:hypothetical protein
VTGVCNEDWLTNYSRAETLAIWAARPTPAQVDACMARLGLSEVNQRLTRRCEDRKAAVRLIHDLAARARQSETHR